MEVLQKDTYLQMIQNAVDAKLFQTVYVSDGGERKDILGKGDLSCAFFVSTILHHFKLIDAPHVTVASTMRDMEKNNWHNQSVQPPEVAQIDFSTVPVGAVLVWEEKEQKGEVHTHIGFCIGNNQAVSNNPEGDTPFMHHVTFDDTRAVAHVYTHDFLK